MSTILAVLNPRDITECMWSLKRLPVRKVWLRRMTETQIAQEWPGVVSEARERGHTHLSVISDDTIVPRPSWEALRRNLADDVCVTGWCNLQLHADSRVNLSNEPLPTYLPEVASYDFPTAWDVLAGPKLRESFFTGMCLTTMPLELWDRFPFMVYPPGFASDYHLSYRLQAAKVPIRCVRGAFVKHVKGTFNAPDNTPGRQLLIGTEPPEIAWDD